MPVFEPGEVTNPGVGAGVLEVEDGETSVGMQTPVAGLEIQVTDRTSIALPDSSRAAASKW